MIYIDPPYNTGNDFVYNDNYSMSPEDYHQINGDYSEFGDYLVLNSDNNGRFHTDWLNMIYPRLLLAKDFLSDDGAIFVSIDDNEQANLRCLCDEIFGERNFITTFVWAAGRKNDSKLVSVSHEYILCYAKSACTLRERNIKWREKKQGLDEIYREYDLLRKQYGSDDNAVESGLNQWYKSLNPNDPAKNHKHYNKVDKRGIYFAADISWPGGGGPKYDVLHPVTKKPVKKPSRGWLYSESRLKELIDDDRIQFGDDETSVPCVKSYLKDREYSAPYSVFYKDGRAATKRLRDLMGSDLFQNPKDETIIQSLIQFCTDKDSIIMDFFSGSATTAHSTFLQNKLDGGSRSFIMVQIPDSIDNLKKSSESSKSIHNNVLAFLGNKPHNICEIAKQRIRLAGLKIGEQRTLDCNQDYGFRVFKLDSSNMTNVFYEPESIKQMSIDEYGNNVKSDRSPEDLLIQVMLELGIELSSKIETVSIEGNSVFIVDNGYLVAFLSESYSEDIITTFAKRDCKPVYAVIRNGSGMTDEMLSNIEQIFKTYSPGTTVRWL